MALQTELNYRGLLVPASYCKISNMSWAGGNYVSVAVDVYASETAKDAGEPPLSSEDILIPLNDQQKLDTYNLLKTELYTHLKTLPKYLNSLDV